MYIECVIMLVFSNTLKVHSVWQWAELKHCTKQCRRIWLWRQVQPQWRTGMV